jgi:hypothetical protein
LSIRDVKEQVTNGDYNDFRVLLYKPWYEQSLLRVPFQWVDVCTDHEWKINKVKLCPENLGFEIINRKKNWYEETYDVKQFKIDMFTREYEFSRKQYDANEIHTNCE